MNDAAPIFAAQPPAVGQRTLMLYLGVPEELAGRPRQYMRGRVFMREAHPHCPLQRWFFADGTHQDVEVASLADQVAIVTSPDGGQLVDRFVPWTDAIELVYQLAGVLGVDVLSRAVKVWEMGYDPDALYQWALRVERERTSSEEMHVGPEAVAPAGQDAPRELEVDDETLTELALQTGQPVCTLMPDATVKPGQVREFGHRLRIHPDDLESWKRTAANNGYAIRIETMETAGGVN